MNSELSYINAYFAHQPIFDAEGKIWGYELFYRHDAEAESALFTDDAKATMEVLANLAVSPDDNLKAAKLVLNFSSEAIHDGTPHGLFPELSVLEIEDPATLDASLLEKIASLKEEGFSISVENYKALDANIELYELADILAIDTSTTPRDTARKLVQRHPALQARYLAEKIEAFEKYEESKEDGFSLFQGFFFERPKTNVLRKITSAESLKFKLLGLLNNPDADFESLSEAIKVDVSLSLRLLNLLNSPAYGLTSKISSVKQASVYLGLKQLKQWLRVIVLTDMQPSSISMELTRSSLHRAKFLELLSESTGHTDAADVLFLLGLFSRLDAMLDMPMEEVVRLLTNLDDDVRQTLSGEETTYLIWLQLVESVEHSEWDRTGQWSAVLRLDTSSIMQCYAQSREWSNNVLANV